MSLKRVRRATKPFDNSLGASIVTLQEEIRLKQDKLTLGSPSTNITLPSNLLPPSSPKIAINTQKPSRGNRFSKFNYLYFN